MYRAALDLGARWNFKLQILELAYNDLCGLLYLHLSVLSPCMIRLLQKQRVLTNLTASLSYKLRVTFCDVSKTFSVSPAMSGMPTSSKIKIQKK